MRILHTSDWHLGRSFHGEGLERAHARYFEHLIDIAETRKVDAVLVSGDIYDRALPNPKTVEALDDVLVRLLATGVHVVLTSGNHDSAIRLGFASRILEAQGLHIRTDASAITQPVAVPARDGSGLAGYVVTIPYLEPQVVAPHLEAAEATHACVLAKAVEQGVQAARSAPQGEELPIVGMLHSFFAGATTSESERDISVGGLGVAPIELLKGLDYAALGHLHGHQVLAERVRYSGSPVAMSFSEANHTKGTWLVDVTADSFAAEFIEAPVDRGLSILRGQLETLLTSDVYTSAEDDFCQVTLTDAVRPERAIDRVRTRFPHTLKLQFELAETAEAAVSYARRVQGRSDQELCCGFLEHVRGGRGPSATERDAIERAIAYSHRTSAATEATK